MRLTHHTDNDPLKYISKESFKIINNAIKNINAKFNSKIVIRLDSLYEEIFLVLLQVCFSHFIIIFIRLFFPFSRSFLFISTSMLNLLRSKN